MIAADRGLEYYNEVTTKFRVSSDQEVTFVKLVIISTIYFGGYHYGYR